MRLKKGRSYSQVPYLCTICYTQVPLYPAIGCLCVICYSPAPLQQGACAQFAIHRYPYISLCTNFLLSPAPLKPLDIVQNIDIWQVMISYLIYQPSQIIRERAKFIRNPGRVYRQGGTDFF